MNESESMFPFRRRKRETAPRVDTALREYAYQKALGYKEQKLNRTREYVRRLERALAKQKAQTADDQRYIDLLEAAIDHPTLAEIRDEARAFRRREMEIDDGFGI
jgi:hypothetical protein